MLLWLRMHTYEHLFLCEFEFRSNLVLVQISQLVDSLALLHLTVQVRVHFLQLPVEFELRLRSDVVTQALHVIRVANTSVQSGDVLNGMETFQLEERKSCTHETMESSIQIESCKPVTSSKGDIS